VLREVGLVTVREDGPQRFYRLDAAKLKPIRDWVKGYERFWEESLDRLGEYLDDVQKSGDDR